MAAKKAKKTQQKQPKKEKKGLKVLARLSLIAAAISAVEALLIFAGVLPPVLANSPGNLLFSLATVALVVYTGVLYSKDDWKISFITGANVAFISAFVLCLAAGISYRFIHKTVLGVFTWNSGELFFIAVAIMLQSAIAGALIGGISGLVAKKLRG